jgi:hypothetical protein
LQNTVVHARLPCPTPTMRARSAFSTQIFVSATRHCKKLAMWASVTSGAAVDTSSPRNLASATKSCAQRHHDDVSRDTTMTSAETPR